MWIKWTNFINEGEEDFQQPKPLSISKKNTSQIGVNVKRCNFNEFKFENIDISGTNLNGGLLFNSKRKNIKFHELNTLDGS
ncbi:unnamed protein product [Paramecium sonneborni]|uniref:Pentapeptide repeat-containing protein n=1 Tax=Paramecium sonneborni TaxID=65129 RepID=A0A8S1MAD5_9CILI|nr:unnamed protein product [Paramecium sonneborni]